MTAHRDLLGHPWGWGAERLAVVDGPCPDCKRRPPKSCGARWLLEFADGTRRCGACAETAWRKAAG